MALYVFLYDIAIITVSVKDAFSGLFFRNINAVVIVALLSTKPCLSFLKFYFLAKIFGETFIMSVKPTSFPKET